jgi:pimeloyl-ACP methyl ester carboxylesterase
MPADVTSARPCFRDRWLTAQDGLELYYRDYGDPLSKRLPVLCLTGLSRNSRDFRRLAHHLAKDRRVLAPDYRGRGRSSHDPDWRHYDPGTIVNDLRHLMAATNLHRVIVVGTSFGGILAMALGVALPRALAGVVLNDVGPEIGADSQTRILDYIGKGLPQPDWPQAVAHLRQLLPTLSLQTDEDWLEFAQDTYRQDPNGTLQVDWDVNIVRPFLRPPRPSPDLWPLFRSLRRVPVLALRGALSDLLTPQAFDRMAEEHPGLVQVTVPDAGHAPTLNEPKSVAAIDTFLARL